ncbi:phosphatase PAP2 family protein [Ihubacter sp. mB4P-1]|uniref:phosphatase PAP2 family protein n=1 Tax=Ihubacter sp. mB4P-1 TaxID=3242370 RepID=UPI003C7C200C
MKIRGREIEVKKYRHLLLILYVPVYLISFFAMEYLVPETAEYWASYCPLDDLIPFCEYFIVPYYLWYILLFVVGIWLLIHDIPVFRLYMYCIICGFSLSILLCIVFPNGQDLRPETFERDNVFVDLVRFVYAADTNTNVIPSMHALGAIFAAMAISASKKVQRVSVKVFTWILAALICAATCFVKQHSALDVAASVVLGATIYAILRKNIINKNEDS